MSKFTLVLMCVTFLSFLSSLSGCGLCRWLHGLSAWFCIPALNGCVHHNPAIPHTNQPRTMSCLYRELFPMFYLTLYIFGLLFSLLTSSFCIFLFLAFFFLFPSFFFHSIICLSSFLFLTSSVFFLIFDCSLFSYFYLLFLVTVWKRHKEQWPQWTYSRQVTINS